MPVYGKSEVEAQLEKVLTSPGFANASQLQALLRLAVNRALAGETGGIKEYTLGVEALGRPESFDPRVDPIVRVQARRLRAKLEDYYSDEGRSDPICITLPKGGYVPEFRPGSKTPAPVSGAVAIAAIFGFALLGLGLLFYTRPSTPARPAIAVLPMQNLVDDPGRAHLPGKLTEGLTTELAKLPGLEVRSRTSAMQFQAPGRSLPEIARELRVSAVVEGGVATNGNRTLVKLRLVDADADAKIWAQSYEFASGDFSPNLADMANEISNALARSWLSR